MRLTVYLLGLLILQTACTTTKVETKSAGTQPHEQELQDKIEDLSESISDLAQSLTQVVAAEAKKSSEYVSENKEDIKQQLHQLSLKMDALARDAADSSHEGLKTLLSRMEDAVDDLNDSLKKETNH